MKKLTLITIVLMTANLLFAQIINIPDDYPTIQQGVNAANDGDTVLVQPGTYTENIWIGGDITLTSIFLFTQDTSDISSTIIDGNQEGTVINMEQPGISSYNLTVSGFTIKNGLADGGPASCGGGIYYSQWTPMEDNITLKNLIIANNSADNWIGGGIGGGIYLKCPDYDSLTTIRIQNVSVINNYSREGGGIYCENINPILQNVTIDTNRTYCNGGGMFFLNSNPKLQNVLITSNIAVGGLYCQKPSGGGIYFENSNPVILNTTLKSNAAANIGGGFCCIYSNPTLINTILWDNSPEEIALYLGSEVYPNSITNSYCDIFGGEDGIFSGVYDTIHWLEGNIDEDPLFEETGDHPYILSDESPCVNAGTSDTTGLNLPELDLAGNPRLCGRIDMGAYENQVIVSTKKPIYQLLSTEIEIYPNPAKNKLSISTKDGVIIKEINIYNQIGQRVIHKKGISKTVDVSKLRQGMYIIEFQINNRAIRSKLLID